VLRTASMFMLLVIICRAWIGRILNIVYTANVLWCATLVLLRSARNGEAFKVSSLTELAASRSPSDNGERERVERSASRTVVVNDRARFFRNACAVSMFLANSMIS